MTNSSTFWSKLRRFVAMSSDQENNWTTDDRCLLYLASASYRGVFQGGNWAPDHATKIGEGIQECLQNAPAGFGDWKIVWGPIVHRTPHAEFDDGCMYVAHSAGRFAVVIRGTNPGAIRDWLFGDFQVHEQVEWPFSPDAKVSVSTALGLVSLLTAGAQRTPTGHLAALIKNVGDALTQEKLSPQGFLSPQSSQVSDTTTIDLVSFLRGAVNKANATVEIVVTGHSKGGALAPALVQWLADSKGADGSAQHGWTPDQVKLRCISYAGPTPGNDRFADRVVSTMGDNFRRIWNRRDVVPHAFDDIQWANTYYQEGLLLKPEVARLLQEVKGRYKQIGEGVSFSGPEGLLHPPSIVSAPFQHLDAYLDEMQIPHEALWFMGLMHISFSQPRGKLL